MDSDNLVDAHSKALRTTLQEISSQNSPTTNTDSKDCCVICLDRVSEQARAIPCQHKSFDFLCLLSWLEQRTTCPLCKAEVLNVQYDFRADKKYKIYNVSPPKTTARADLPSTRRNIDPKRRGAYHSRRSYVPRPHHTADEALLRRRYVYRNNLYSLHVGTNRLSRFRDLTPQVFSTDTELNSRARTWIRRELQVFEFLSGDVSTSPNPTATRQANNAEFLLEYIIAILKTVDTQGSGGQAEDMLQEFLGRENTRLFLHELRAWLRSPYTSLEDWDRAVQYAEPRKHWNRETQPSEQRSTGFHATKGSRSFELSSRYTPHGAGRRQAQGQARQRYVAD